MKRVGFLIEQIADMDNLRLAFYKAQRGKNEKIEVLAYRALLETHLMALRAQLLKGEVNVGSYRLFKIFDPKERIVCAAAFSERVLHHAILNICEPYFERHMITTTYANRTGKGVYKALEKAFVSTNHHAYVAKLDVRKYFDSVDHHVLQNQLMHLFKDKLLLGILSKIIASYHVESGKGLPIGNLTSQYFANYYLSILDHYAKEELHVPVYIRYMDDILIYGNDRAQLTKQVKAIITYAKEHLALTMKNPIIQTTHQGINFLGYHLRTHVIGVARRSRVRFEHKLKVIMEAYKKEKLTEQELQSHTIPLFAFAGHAYTKNYKKKVMEKVASRLDLTA